MTGHAVDSVFVGTRACEEREKQREEELKSLKEAVEIMSNATK